MSTVITHEVKVKATKKNTIAYNKFRGVDFTTDPALVDRTRSPYALNLVSDVAGMPEKRLGWRSLHEVTGEKVYGLWYGEVNGNHIMIAHIGNWLYEVTDDTLTQIAGSLVPSKPSAGCFMKRNSRSYFYMFVYNGYLRYDGTNVVTTFSVAYVPTVIISKNPDGTGGQVYESVNMVTNLRTESFLGNNSDTIYYLSAKAPDLISVDKVEVMNAQGEFVTEVAGTDYSVNLTNGTVTFLDGPHDVIIAGQDNVRITYGTFGTPGLHKLEGCNILTKYGYGGENRLFVTGYEGNKNFVWYSDINNPEYFPDNNYVEIGDANSAIMGFLKLGKYLIIVKENGGGDSTVYQMWGEMDSDGNITFLVQQGISGIGAIAKGSFENLIDEPLFLTRRGIYAVTDYNILAERALKNRSYYLDTRLLKEIDLENAVSCEWQGYYILCVNTRCYILDSRQKSYRPNQTNSDNDFLYDAYYWDNIPAVCWLPMDDELYFGTEDGRICKFNTDKDQMDKYNDNGFLLDPDDGSDGDAIVAIWTTKQDDDGASWLYKSMQKKGCSVTIKPYYKASAQVYISKDGYKEFFVREGNVDLLIGFDDMDFERFSFETNTTPKDIYLKKKVKKYKRLQIIVRNGEKSEGFGIFQITKTYAVGNFAKK